MTDMLDRAKHLLEGVTDGPWTWDEWPDCSQIGSPTGSCWPLPPASLFVSSRRRTPDSSRQPVNSYPRLWPKSNGYAPNSPRHSQIQEEGHEE